MANTFKVITRDLMSTSANTDETLYTTQSGSTVFIIGFTMANVHTAQVTATVSLTSTTTQTSQTQNTTAHIAKSMPIAVGQTVDGIINKIILNVGDIIKVDCSVADKLSVTFNYMEIT